MCRDHVPNIVQIIQEDPTNFPFQKPLPLTDLFSSNASAALRRPESRPQSAALRRRRR